MLAAALILLAPLLGRGGATTVANVAMALASLPLPEDRAVKQRAKNHRDGALAMARAFAHCGRPEDRELLRRSSRQNPLLIWPMRYAEAHLSLQHGDNKQAKRLLSQAPAWPPQSVFRDLTQSLKQALNGC